MIYAVIGAVVGLFGIAVTILTLVARISSTVTRIEVTQEHGNRRLDAHDEDIRDLRAALTRRHSWPNGRVAEEDLG